MATMNISITKQLDRFVRDKVQIGALQQFQ